MTREDMINLAAETLDCKAQTAHGRWIYHERQTAWWVVTDDVMADLGRRLANVEQVAAETDTAPDEVKAIALLTWSAETTATEVDIDRLVQQSGITSATDLDALMADACNTILSLVLRFARPDVEESIRFNASVTAFNEANR